MRLDECSAIWRDASAEPRAECEPDALSVEHRDFVARLSTRDVDMAVTQPRRVISTENALRVLLALALVRRGGLLLHAAGVVRHGAATVLFGRSGSGKTTVARLARGRAVLGDDLVALSRGSDGWRAHSTPFGGGAARRRSRRSVPLGSLLRLRQSEQLGLGRMGAAAGIASLLQSAVLPVGTPADRELAFASCVDLIAAVPARELSFPIDRSLWRWLDDRHI